MQSLKIFFRFTVVNALVFARHLLAAPFSKQSRHKLSGAYQMLEYPFFGDRYKELSNLLKNDDLKLSLAPVKARLHNVTEFELLSICALLKDNRCNSIFEIGTFDGRTTRAMAMNLDNDNGCIYTINLPPQTAEVSLETSNVDVNLASKVVSGERFLQTNESRLIKQLWGDSARFDFSPYAGNMDMVFIDGAHSKPYAENDTRAAIKMIKPSGGIIVWHDAHLFGVVEFLKEWIQKENVPVYFIKQTTLAVAFVKEGKISEWNKAVHS